MLMWWLLKVTPIFDRFYYGLALERRIINRGLFERLWSSKGWEFTGLNERGIPEFRNDEVLLVAARRIDQPILIDIDDWRIGSLIGRYAGIPQECHEQSAFVGYLFRKLCSHMKQEIKAEGKMLNIVPYCDL